MASAPPAECAAYGVEMQARCIAAVPQTDTAGDDEASSTDVHPFLVATNGMRGTNKLHLLEFREAAHVVECAAVWDIGPTTDLAVSPHGAKVMAAAVHASPTGGPFLSLFALSAGLVGDLEHVATNCPLMTSCSAGAQAETGLSQVLWDPNGAQDRIIVTSLNRVSIVNVPATSVTQLAVESSVALPTTVRRLHHAAWDVHHSELVALGADRSVLLCDRRAKTMQTVISEAHGILGVRAISFNPNRLNIIATGGDDGYMRFWDLRKPSAGPLATHLAHDQAVRSLKYNPAHDELLLTAGQDNAMRVWCISALSSKPLAQAQQAGGSTAPLQRGKDGGVLRTLQEFGDTVCSAAWASGSPWIFAACAFNGKLLFDKVPEEHKMAILMHASE